MHMDGLLRFSLVTVSLFSFFLPLSRSLSLSPSLSRDQCSDILSDVISRNTVKYSHSLDYKTMFSRTSFHDDVSASRIIIICQIGTS